MMLAPMIRILAHHPWHVDQQGPEVLEVLEVLEVQEHHVAQEVLEHHVAQLVHNHQVVPTS
jgi:hypothetical protein